jgi:methanogenic corrinoid protein MtbC1/DNA-binding XRE family transcriptional regulator
MIEERKQFESAVFRGDVDTALLIVNQLRFQYSPIEIYDSLLIPVQQEVTQQKESRTLARAEQHLASQITTAAMNAVRSTPYACLPLGCSAVISTLAGDHHTFGARASSDCLQFDGWCVQYLGANTPAQDIYNFALDNKIDLIVVSVTREDVVDEFQKIYDLVTTSDSKVALLSGGCAIESVAAGFEPHKKFTIARSVEEGLHAARELVGLRDPEENLQRALELLGRGLRSLRKQRKLSQNELASQSGVDRTYLSMLESGRQNPSLFVLAKIASVLNLSLPELLCSYLLDPEEGQNACGQTIIPNSVKRRRFMY